MHLLGPFRDHSCQYTPLPFNMQYHKTYTIITQSSVWLSIQCQNIFCADYSARMNGNEQIHHPWHACQTRGCLQRHISQLFWIVLCLFSSAIYQRLYLYLTLLSGHCGIETQNLLIIKLYYQYHHLMKRRIKRCQHYYIIL